MLTSLAEAITESGKTSEEERDHALRLLREALELFQRCLNLQEYKYDEIQEDAARAVGEPLIDGGDGVPNSSSTRSYASEEEVWASIEEPITKETLLDTAIAELGTLTTICNLGSCQDHSGLAWIEEYYRGTLQGKINYYLGATARQAEAALATAKFMSAILDAAFRKGRLDLLTYEREMTALFTSSELSPVNDPEGLCGRADAELRFNASVQTSAPNAQLEGIPQVAGICWKHITKALDSFTAASKLPNTLDLPRVHIRRGDCEMLRLQLGEAPLNFDLAMKSMPTLLKNAEVYYRGAGTLAKRSKIDADEQNEAEVKAALAAALADDTQRLTVLIKQQRGFVEMIVEEMKDESLLGEEGLQKLGPIFV